MTARGPELSRLEGTLRAVGQALDYPSDGEVSPAVARRLREALTGRRAFRLRWLGVPSPRPRAVLRPAWHAAVAAALAIALLFSALFASSPAVRRTVERWLGLRGVKVVEVPRPSTLPPAQELDLGRRVGEGEASAHLEAPLLFPSGLGRPDELWVRDLSVGGSEVFLVYRSRPGIPRSRTTGVALLVSEFTGTAFQPGIEKLSFGARISRVTVGGKPGLWVEGAHAVAYLDRNGEIVPDALRLAGNVLLWEQGGLTLRIESSLPMPQALALASTFR